MQFQVRYIAVNPQLKISYFHFVACIKNVFCIQPCLLEQYPLFYKRIDGNMYFSYCHHQRERFGAAVVFTCRK